MLLCDSAGNARPLPHVLGMTVTQPNKLILLHWWCGKHTVLLVLVAHEIEQAESLMSGKGQLTILLRQGWALQKQASLTMPYRMTFAAA